MFGLIDRMIHFVIFVHSYDEHIFVDQNVHMLNGISKKLLRKYYTNKLHVELRDCV